MFSSQRKEIPISIKLTRKLRLIVSNCSTFYSPVINVARSKMIFYIKPFPLLLTEVLEALNNFFFGSHLWISKNQNINKYYFQKFYENTKRSKTKNGSLLLWRQKLLLCPTQVKIGKGNIYRRKWQRKWHFQPYYMLAPLCYVLLRYNIRRYDRNEWERKIFSWTLCSRRGQL